MRIIPIVTAVVVMAVLYLAVFERDRLMDYVSGGDSASEAAEVMAGDDAGTAEAAPDSETSAPVRVIALKSQAQVIDSAVVLRGQTEASRQVEVRAETSGLVISDPLRKGTRVETGEALCELDSGTRETALAEAEARLEEARARLPEAEARLAEAEARLEEARINDNAASKLSRDGFASDTRVASAQATVRAAEAGVQSARSGLSAAGAGISSASAAVAAAEREISRLVIRAPFGGMLEVDTAELGSLLQPGALCASVLQLDPIKLVGFVPETEVDRVSPGARAGGRLVNGTEIAGTVSFLARSADPSTRTFRVEIEVANADLTIRDGQTVEMIIAAEGADAHLLPQSALTLADDGSLGVRLVDADERAQFAAVTLLRDTARGVWVTGLPEEARVITVGQEYVTDGVPVLPSYEALVQ